jgi:outer membrane protein assembly factor BamA
VLASGSGRALAQESTGTPSDDAPAVGRRGIDGLGVPLVAYTTDLGFSIGAVGGAYFYAPGYLPYRHGVALQVFYSTRGVQNHFLRYDGPELIAGLRVELRLEYRRELLSPFYGAGNVSAPEFSGDTRDEYFNYQRTSPAAWIRFRARPFGDAAPLQTYLGYGYRHVRIASYENSLLLMQKPRGIEGGGNGQLSMGALWDTRDEEGDPTHGGMEEIALRLSSEATGSRYRYVGLTVADRRFFSLGSPRLVFAQRLAVDYLVGDVPFFEWPMFGGVTFTEGIGGMGSVRGVPRNRFSGNLKVVSNSELRYYFYDFRILGRWAKAGVTGFFDVGRVWHPGVDDGTIATWHPGVGGGLRVARRSAVIRVDYALSTETWRQGLYVTFGHMF